MKGYKVSSFAAGKDFYRRYAKKSMFKIVYHGGLTDPMAGLMAVPEARQVQKKMASTGRWYAPEI